jgi:FAD/FMN-containing dehydrogenase
VGVSGYTLGGGIGWLGRKHGFATNSVTAVELVTADGELVRADAEQHADLFWAVRGGGGSFGVVTALEFRLYPLPDVFAGMMLWDIEHAEPVLRRWAEWSVQAPDEVTTSFRIMRFPPMPELPEFLRGRSLVIVDGAVLGDDGFGAASPCSRAGHGQLLLREDGCRPGHADAPEARFERFCFLVEHESSVLQNAHAIRNRLDGIEVVGVDEDRDPAIGEAPRRARADHQVWRHPGPPGRDARRRRDGGDGAEQRALQQRAAIVRADVRGDRGEQHGVGTRGVRRCDACHAGRASAAA